MSDGRTLTVACYGGLANRLRVLSSALVMAEATGRALTMQWHRMPTCGALFHELYSNNWPVIDFDQVPETRLPAFAGPLGRGAFDLLTATEPEIALSYVSWLALPRVFPGHAPLLERCAGVLDQLRPLAEIEARARTFQQEHFRPEMIGVHLRRGDFYRAYFASVDNTATAMAAVRHFGREWPEAGIFLCTDDGGVDPVTKARPTEGAREKLRQAFGDRVIWTEPRSLDPGDSVAVQDALVDLLLLRVCDCVVGTWWSSFSELAVFGRNVPAVMCRSDGLVGWVDRVGNAIGLWVGLDWLVGRLTGGRASGSHVLQHWLAGARPITARLLRQCAPGLYERLRPRRRE